MLVDQQQFSSDQTSRASNSCQVSDFQGVGQTSTSHQVGIYLEFPGKVRKFRGVDGRETKTHSTNDAQVNLGDLRQAIEQQMSVPKATSDWGFPWDVDGLLVPNV